MSNDKTDAVIEAIDGALGDWSVSGDAMRWQPPESELVVSRPRQAGQSPWPDTWVRQLGRDLDQHEGGEWFVPVATARGAQIVEHLMTEAGQQELHEAALAFLSVDASVNDTITVTIEPDTSRFDAALEELRVSFVVFSDQVTRAALVLGQAGIRTVKDVDRRIRRWQVEQRRIRQAMRHIERRAARRRRRAARTAQ